MSRKTIYWGCTLTVILAGLTFILGFDRKNYTDYPVTVYQVYLNGKAIGVIEEEEDLYNLIDKEQNELKEEFNVKKIYAPIGLETTKLVTYEGKVDSVDTVYDKIKDAEHFTVKGYEITIALSEDKIEKINVLNKKDFDESIENTIKAFVNAEQYIKYLNSSQDEITTTGQKIDDIYLREKITIKEKYLSTDEKVYTNSSDLSKYLLFGTDEKQGTHVVKAGETLSEIANTYQLSLLEFLIVNPELTSEKTLLFPGQEVNIGLVNPIISVVVENTIVEDKVVEYDQDIEYDKKLSMKSSYQKQAGQNGLNRETYHQQTINGPITQVVTDESKRQVLVPVVNEIIVKGGLPSQNWGDEGFGWLWPTRKPYVLTSNFGWRTDPVYGGHSLHNGLDISGTGYGSPIYASKYGEIVELGYDRTRGNYIIMDHGGGWQSIYMHMSDFYAEMRIGRMVERGEQIGYMGSTGKSTGTHLHFSITKDGTYVDPLGMKYN